MATLNDSEGEIIRPAFKFDPPIWKDTFTSFSLSDSEYESYSAKTKLQKETVLEMLVSSTVDPIDNLIFIDQLCRLGVSYHFESMIQAQLHQFQQIQPISVFSDYDLYTVALVFRVLRQHGFKVSCDVFSKFMDDGCKFKETLKGDARGMLSLYEASHVRTHGEDILEEALAFTSSHLEALANRSSPHLATHIINALNYTYHKSMERIETRKYISFYEQEEAKNETLLEFAKMDFNLLQLLHREELKGLHKWYKDLNIASQLPYARDRVVELYFWAYGTYFEPQFSRARVMLTKIIAIISLLDDTYDVYGTIDELNLFTRAIERWESCAPDDLPPYMKILYMTIFNLYDEFEVELRNEGRSDLVSYAKNALTELVKAYHQEAKWAKEGYVAKFEEYLSNGLFTSAFHPITAGSFIGLGNTADLEAFIWLSQRPKILRAVQAIGRLMNDVVSHEREKKIGDVASGVECYMKEHNVTREEANRNIRERIRDAWKDINEESLSPTKVPTHLLKAVLNQGRISDIIYKYDDGYTNGEAIKDHINFLFIHSFSL